MSKKNKNDQKKPGSCPLRGVDCIEGKCEWWIVDVIIEGNITRSENGRCETAETNRILRQIFNTLEQSR